MSSRTLWIASAVLVAALTCLVLARPQADSAGSEPLDGPVEAMQPEDDSGGSPPESDGAVSTLRLIASGKFARPDDVATRRVRDSLPEYKALFATLDWEHPRTIRRTQDSLRVEFQVLDAKTGTPSGRYARLRMLREDADWLLDLVRVGSEGDAFDDR